MTETMMAIASPCASAIATRSPPPVITMAPAPKKISANVPTNSATAALPTLSTFPSLVDDDAPPNVAEEALSGKDLQVAW